MEGDSEERSKVVEKSVQVALDDSLFRGEGGSAAEDQSYGLVEAAAKVLELGFPGEVEVEWYT